MKQKILAVLLSAALVCSVLPAAASAADGLTLAAENASAVCTAGTEITVPVLAEQNTGFAAGTVDITWDSSALTLKSVDYSEEMPAINPPEIISDGSYRAQIGSYQAKENFTLTDALFTMTFAVSDSALPGDYAVIPDHAVFYDAEMNEIPVLCKTGVITLTGDAPANTLLLEAGSGEGTSGGEIRIPVTASQNPGFAAGTVDVLWDAGALTLTAVEYSSFAPDDGSAEIVSDGNYRIKFGNHLAEADVTDTGELFTLIFTADASAAGEYEIALGNASVYNAALHAVPTSVKSGIAVITDQTETSASSGTTETTGTTDSTASTVTTDSTTSASVSKTTESTASASSTYSTETTSTTSATKTTESTASTSSSNSTETTSTTSATKMTDSTASTSSSDSTETTSTTSATKSTDSTASTSSSDSTETTSTTSATKTTDSTASTSSSDSTETTSTTSATKTTDSTASTSSSDSTETTSTTSATKTTDSTASTSSSDSTETSSTTSATESTDTTSATSVTQPDDTPEGDYNGDGEVSLADAVMLARFIAEDDTLTADEIAGVLNAQPDRDKDGTVTLLDIRALLRKLE